MDSTALKKEVFPDFVILPIHVTDIIGQIHRKAFKALKLIEAIIIDGFGGESAKPGEDFIVGVIHINEHCLASDCRFGEVVEKGVFAADCFKFCFQLYAVRPLI